MASINDLMYEFYKNFSQNGALQTTLKGRTEQLIAPTTLEWDGATESHELEIAVPDYVKKLLVSVKQGGENALMFNGLTGGYVRIPSDNADEFNALSALTLEARFRASAESTGSDVRNLVSKFISGTNGSWMLTLETGKLTTGVVNSSDTMLTLKDSDSPSLLDGQEHHVAMVWDGSKIINYTDGVETNRDDLTGTSKSVDTDVGIGAHMGNVNAFWHGAIYEVRIWKVARTPTQITESMNSVITGADLANMLGYYRFDEGSGAVLGDTTANENDGDIAGAAYWGSVPALKIYPEFEVATGEWARWSVGGADVSLDVGVSKGYVVLNLDQMPAYGLPFRLVVVGAETTPTVGSSVIQVQGVL